jgi:GNAT superfamily N-acetyltransferase
MPWTMTREPDEFLAAAGEFLRSRPVEHNLILTVTDRLHRTGSGAFGPPPLLGWWVRDGGPAGAFVLTPPYPLSVTAVPDAALHELADALADTPPGTAPAPEAIGAEVGVAERFADRWRARTGAGVRVHRRMRLYRLGGLQPPDPAPPGRARPIAAADRELVVAWLRAFGAELGEGMGDVAANFADRLGYGGMLLWEVGGAPVSMAGRTPVLAGMARVAPVYTPAEHRGHGYGSAATAAVSRSALAAGACDVLLFTDLANPTSNAIYQRLGYRPVEDRVVLSFDATGGDRSP